MVRFDQLAALLLFSVAVVGCGSQGSPVSPAAGAAAAVTTQAWGPENPNFNLEVVLRGNSGFGLVKFRQPNDSEFVVYLDVWVRDLLPNTAYRLQRAVDTTLDGSCTSTDWLTLGQGLTPQGIVTDDRGTGRAALWRAVPPQQGSSFDIHFRVVADGSNVPVLQSDCYEYTISL